MATSQVDYDLVGTFIFHFELMCHKKQCDVNDEFKNLLKNENITINDWISCGQETLKGWFEKGIKMDEKDGKFIRILTGCAQAINNPVKAKNGVNNMVLEDVKAVISSKLRQLLQYFDGVFDDKEEFPESAGYHLEMYFSVMGYAAIYVPKDTNQIHNVESYISTEWEQTHQKLITWHRQLFTEELLTIAVPSLYHHECQFLDVYIDDNTMCMHSDGSHGSGLVEVSYALCRMGQTEVTVSVYERARSKSRKSTKSKKKVNRYKSSIQRGGMMTNNNRFHGQLKQIKASPSSFRNNSVHHENGNNDPISTKPKHGRCKNNNKYHHKNRNNNRARYSDDYQSMLDALKDMRNEFINKSEMTVEKMDRINEMNQQKCQEIVVLLRHEISQLKKDIAAKQQQESLQKNQTITRLKAENEKLQKILKERNDQIETLQRIQEMSQQQQVMTISQTMQDFSVNDDDNKSGDHGFEEDEDFDLMHGNHSQYNGDLQSDLNNLDGIIELVQNKQRSSIQYSSLNDLPSASPSPSHYNRSNDEDLSDNDDEKNIDKTKKPKRKQNQNSNTSQESSEGDNSGDESHCSNYTDIEESSSSDPEPWDEYVPGVDDNPNPAKITFERPRKSRKKSKSKSGKSTKQKSKTESNDNKNNNKNKEEIAKQLGSFQSTSTHPEALSGHIIGNLLELNNKDYTQKYINVMDDITKHAPTTIHDLDRIMTAYGHRSGAGVTDGVIKTLIVTLIQEYLMDNEITKSPIK